MSSSLARQLAGIGSIDAQRLQASTSKSRASFLFPARQAASLSNNDIHSLGYNGFLSLLDEDARFERYETPIFGEKAKNTDRVLLNKDENDKLDRILGSFMRMLATKLLLKSTGKVLEWLIRRFRINEFNVDDLIALMLPYHETPQFAQMLQIIEFDKGKFLAFQAVKTSLQSLPRHHLITALVKSHDLFLFVATMLKPYLQDACLHTALVAFWTSTLIGYLDRQQHLQESEMSVLLPVIIEGVKSTNHDLHLGSLVVLSRLAIKVDLSNDAVEVLISSVLSRRSADEGGETLEAIISTLIVLCESQTFVLPSLPLKAMSHLLRMTSAIDTILALVASYSATKFLKPFFTTLVQTASSDNNRWDILFDMLAPQSCHAQMTAVALPILLSDGLAVETRPNELVKVLNAIFQHASDQYYSACQTLSQQLESDGKTRLNKLMASVSGYSLFDSAAPSDVDSAIAIASSDAQARAAAFMQILKSAAAESSVLVPHSISTIIFERLADQAPSVAEALFSKNGTLMLSRLVVENAHKILHTSTTLILDSETPRASMLAHLRYLTCPFMKSVAEAERETIKTSILQKVLWPHLLATKANAKTWKGVWEVLALHGDSWRILEGCSDIDKGDNKDAAIAFNDGLAIRLAGNILIGKRPEEFVAFLLADIRGKASRPSTSKLLSCLVLMELLKTGAVEISSGILKTGNLNVKTLWTLAATTTYIPSDESRSVIYAKPSSRKTSDKLDAELIYGALRTLTAPGDAKWCWLVPSSRLSVIASTFKELAVKAYLLAHTADLPSFISSDILKNLFSKAIQDDTLSFLAGIYSSSTQPPALRVIALKDAKIYIQAVRASPANAPNDFQVVLPSLIVALSAAEKEIRSAALAVIDKLFRNPGKAVADQRIYGFDAFYGVNSRELQYLDLHQVNRYATLLTEARNELVLDGAYLSTLHATKLIDSSVSKKGRALSYAILCFLVSHAAAWNETSIRAVLLSCMRDTEDDGKIDLFRPFLSEAIRGSQEVSILTPEAAINSYTQVLLEAFAVVPRSGLDNETLTMFLRLLENKKMDRLAIAMRKHARIIIQNGLFDKISADQRLLMLERIISLLFSVSSSEIAAHRQLIHGLAVDNACMTAFFQNIRKSLGPKPEPASKKAKTGTASSRSDRLLELSASLETMDVAKFPASPDLLAVMLDILSTLIDLSVTSQVDISYHGDLLMAAMSRVCLLLGDMSVPNMDGIRISPVLEMIRISSNPQVSNRALDLITDLVVLVPDQVAQNIMPIFTFMGTNVLQRDDAYSSRVVDKTIERIVPALVNYRRQSQHQTEADLSDILQVFVDAVNHVPRHRRKRLFSHFVEILGPADFLAPVCGLLVEKAALKYVKMQDTDLLVFPLALSGSFAADIQLLAYHRLLDETRHKVQILNTEAPEKYVGSRLSTPSTIAGSPGAPVTVSRKTVLSTLSFLNIAVTSKTFLSKVEQARSDGENALRGGIQDFFQFALSFHVKPQKLTEGDLAYIFESIEVLARSITKLLTTIEFGGVILWVLESPPSSRATKIAYGLLVNRLNSIKSMRRPDLTAAISASITNLVNDIKQASNKVDKVNIYQTLRELTGKTIEQELPSVNEALSTILDLALYEESKSSLNQQILFIAETIPRLGARIIPSITRIVTLSTRLASTHVSSAPDSTSKAIIATSFATLEALFSIVPTFVSNHLLAVFQLCTLDSMRQASNGEKGGRIDVAITSLLAAATRDGAPRPLFFTIARLCEDSKASSPQRLIGSLEILLRALRQANVASINQVYKSLFTCILSLFDVRREAIKASADTVEVERLAIAAFIQILLKLSEGMFRPLFLRLFDWAVIDLAGDDSALISRKIVLFKVMDRILVQLKALAVPYYAFMLDQAVELLKRDRLPDDLWSPVITSLQRALVNDSVGFWTAARLAKLVEPIVAQAEVLESLESLSAQVQVHGDRPPTYKITYYLLVRSFAQAAQPYEHVLHDTVKGFLQMTRSLEMHGQLAAIEALRQMWEADISPALAAYFAESMPFLVEALELGGEVERATRSLLNKMNEGHAIDDVAESDYDDSSAEG